MDSGPAARRASSSAQRAGDRVLSSAGRSGTVSTCNVRTACPSTRRFQAASKRSSASAAGPTRISSTFFDTAYVLFEIVAQLLDRLEGVRRRAAAHAPPSIGIFHELAVAQP